MTDIPDRETPTPGPADRVERIIDRQFALMQKQLELIRAVEAAERASGSDGAPASPGDHEPDAGSSSAAGPRTNASIRLVPLSDAQHDVWVVCQLGAESSAAYNLSTTLSLQGGLDVLGLHEALRRLVARHEALRSTIDATGEHMLVHPAMDTAMRQVDLSGLAEPDRVGRVAEILDAELSRPYDLVSGPLFRFTLIRLGTDEHLLVLSAQHLVCDGWSFGVLHRDLGALYTQLTTGGPGPAEDVTQWRDYAAWRVEQGEVARTYWLDRYRDVPAQLDLPTDRARPPLRTFDYGSERMVLEADRLSTLRELAAGQGVTLFVVLLAAWEILLQRLAGQADFANGVFVSGQASMGVRDLVGLCANLLPLRVRIDPDEPLAHFLARLRGETFDAFDHQHYPLGKLVSALQLPRDPSRPLFVSTVITMETPTPGIAFSGLRVKEAVHGRRMFGFFDIELYLTETENDLKIDLQHSTGLFDAETIRRWLTHYLHLLQQMSIDPSAPLAAFDLLDADERRELVTRWNATGAPVPAWATHERFQESVRSAPARIAIRTAAESVTYGELEARANRLARHLRGLGVGRDRLVGVHLDRSPDMVVAMLGVHKAGGAYVPLDPLFPTERLAMIAADAGLHAVVTTEALLGTIDVGDARVVALDRDRKLIDAQEESDPAVPVEPSDLAYAIYTSGSTGRPKGVEIPHVALSNLLESMRQQPGLEPDTALLAVTTMSFDIAGLELFLPLVTGATIVLADQFQAVDALWLRDRLGAGDISVMQATPATWQMLLDAGWAGTPLLTALCGGEALGRELADALVSRVGAVWNMYGPTETTIWSSMSRVAEPGAPISIGMPIANTEFHVLDGSLRLQPIGVAGELFIGGVGLARGYRNRDDLTAERFVTVRFDDGVPRRLYRTGDVVRRLPDGRIEYLGRADFQVKIRGFRIELGEIETVLSRHPGVKDCVVVARASDQGAKRLVAYVIPVDTQLSSVSDLRAHLRETLPEYMVPAVFVMVDAFPMTANLKVDRARLPEPVRERPELGTDLVAPSTEAERALARIWEDILGVQRLGVDDNFFDLGGDSLLALRMIMRANRSGMRLTPISIFRHQTIAELALAAADATDPVDGEQDIPTGPTPLTPAQLRFLTERQTPDPHHWNLSDLVQVEPLDPAALTVALQALLRNHDALRLHLWIEDQVWHQAVAPPSTDIPLEHHDLSELSARDRTMAIEAVCARLQGSFDLARAPLIRVAHFRCGPGEPDRLFIAVHHFSVDGLTWSVLWEDLEQAYRQAAEGSEIALPPKTTSFRSWATQLEQLARSPRVMDTAPTWLRLPWHEVMPLPRDFAAGAAQNTNRTAAVVICELSHDETAVLQTGRRRPEQVILTALGQCLHRWTGSQTILMDVLSHGRDAALDGVNMARTVAFTLSYNPVLLSHPTWAGTPDVLEAVTKLVEDLPEGFSFEMLRFLAPDPGLRHRLTSLPRAELLFNYAGADDAQVAGSMFTPAPEPIGMQESPRGLRQYPVAVRATFAPNLRLAFVYSTELHRAETIELRAGQVLETIRGLAGLRAATR